MLRRAGSWPVRSGPVSSSRRASSIFGSARFRIRRRPTVEQAEGLGLSVGFIQAAPPGRDGRRRGSGRARGIGCREPRPAASRRAGCRACRSVAATRPDCSSPRAKLGSLGDGLLEAVGRLLVVALLIEADAFDVGGLRRHAAAAADGERDHCEAAGEPDRAAWRLGSQQGCCGGGTRSRLPLRMFASRNERRGVIWKSGPALWRPERLGRRTIAGRSRGEQAGNPAGTLALGGRRIAPAGTTDSHRPWPPRAAGKVWPNRKNRTNRTIYANHPVFVIVLLSRGAVPMLACVPEAIFHLAKSQPGSGRRRKRWQKPRRHEDQDAARPSAKTASRKPKTSSGKSVSSHKAHSVGDRK